MRAKPLVNSTVSTRLQYGDTIEDEIQWTPLADGPSSVERVPLDMGVEGSAVGARENFMLVDLHLNRSQQPAEQPAGPETFLLGHMHRLAIVEIEKFREARGASPAGCV